ncbi:type II toxin-antitoxin system VapC family toxin [Terrimicrobium sacchariphilum]|uniref:type II toxin-antitoxin system VapC family toxin n=1 Tax=Terrimicrobium sacchariphilum TaxID=690879 RepID=UPI00129ACF17|nr:type II toxin-antitoxin system VapC family toxin [Terrimicrobium sacchariphilum]
MRRYSAIDTSVLLFLANSDENSQAAIDWLMKNKIHPLVTPTVFQELDDLLREGGAIGGIARKVLEEIPSWGFLHAPLGSLDNGFAYEAAKRLLRILDGDGLLNDGLVAAEAAVLGCDLILTFRNSLNALPDEQLRLCMMEQDLSTTPFVVSPDVIVAYLSKKSETASAQS